MPHEPPPDPSPILDLIEAFRRSKIMFAAIGLGVFDRLEKAPATVAALARDLDMNRDALERLLNACVGLELLARKDIDAVVIATPAATVPDAGVAPLSAADPMPPPPFSTMAATTLSGTPADLSMMS